MAAASRSRSRRIDQLEAKLVDLGNAVARIENRISTSEIGATQGDTGDQKATTGIQNVHSLRAHLEELGIQPSGTKKSFAHNFAIQVTSVVGLQEAVQTKSPVLKCIWIFLFVVGIAATVYFLFSTTSEYLDEPTVTKVKLQALPSYEYPPIVLCHNAWFDTDKALALGLSIDALKYSLGYTFSYTRDLPPVANLSQARSHFLHVFQDHKFKSLLDFFMAISADMEPTNSSQAFYASSIPAYYASNIPARKVFINFLSVCHSFYLNPVSSDLGPLAGDEEIVLKFSDRTNGVIEAGPTWYLYVYETARSMYSWPLIIHPSRNNILKVKASRYITLNTAGSPCVDPTYFTSNIRTSAGCLAECAARAYKERENCRVFWLAPYMDPLPVTEYCNPWDTHDPVKEPITGGGQLKDVAASVVEGFCTRECPRVCDRTLYEASLEGELPFNTRQRRNEAEHPNMSITFMAFRHDALHQAGILTVREVQTYTFTDLVTNVGGTLGLFIGATVMTLVQVILFFVESLSRKEG